MCGGAEHDQHPAEIERMADQPVRPADLQRLARRRCAVGCRPARARSIAARPRARSARRRRAARTTVHAARPAGDVVERRRRPAATDAARPASSRLGDPDVDRPQQRRRHDARQPAALTAVAREHAVVQREDGEQQRVEQRRPPAAPSGEPAAAEPATQIRTGAAPASATNSAPPSHDEQTRDRQRSVMHG